MLLVFIGQYSSYYNLIGYQICYHTVACLPTWKTKFEGKFVLGVTTTAIKPLRLLDQNLFLIAVH